MISVLLKAGKSAVLSVTGLMIVLIAIADWSVGNRASLGLLYILPVMLGAVVLAPLGTIALALMCSALRAWFDLPSPPLEQLLRFIFASLAYSGSGLFVIALIRNRRLAIEHLARIGREQELRQEAQEQLKVLVESSPAAIVTIDDQGTVLASNQATGGLFMLPAGETLIGRAIRDYVPVLADAVELNTGSSDFRTAAQCQGFRANGEIFLANSWFSSYRVPAGLRLAAIIVDASEEMRDREEQSLRQLIRGNRIAAAAVSHEVRNLCGAIALICSNLRQKNGLAQDADMQGLATLVAGLERISSVELQWQAHERVEEVALQQVLDDLRIVIEPAWREIDGVVRWQVPHDLPRVLADRKGLLQAFLNLAQNSARAVQECPDRELIIVCETTESKAIVRLRDTGPGIAAPQHLFEPFQPGANGAGLGLYVSRAVVRSYGGDLRFEPQIGGSCFAIELQVV